MIANAVIRHGAHTVRAPAEAHRQAPRARIVSNVERVSVVTGALIRSSTLTVQAWILTHRIHIFPFIADASTATGIVEETGVAGAYIWCDAPAVRAAVVSAV